MPVNNETALLTEDKEMVFINLPKSDWSMIVECIDHRLYHMDQEYHFFQEQPGCKYYELIEVRDYILSFTEIGNRV